MRAPTIHVASRDPALTRALATHLERGGSLRVVSLDDTVELAGPALAVMSVADCPPQLCRELTFRGVCVVVLATLPSERERETYLQAGAGAYVPMLPGSPLLKAEILRLLRLNGVPVPEEG
jgi:hypothetical protein